MTITEMEKEIIKAIREDSKLPFATDVGHKVVIKLVKKLFNEYRGEREYITGTVIGLLKGDKWVIIIGVMVLSVILDQRNQEFVAQEQIKF